MRRRQHPINPDDLHEILVYPNPPLAPAWFLEKQDAGCPLQPSSVRLYDKIVVLATSITKINTHEIPL